MNRDFVTGNCGSFRNDKGTRVEVNYDGCPSYRQRENVESDPVFSRARVETRVVNARLRKVAFLIHDFGTRSTELTSRSRLIIEITSLKLIWISYNAHMRAYK